MQKVEKKLETNGSPSSHTVHRHSTSPFIDAYYNMSTLNAPFLTHASATGNRKAYVKDEAENPPGCSSTCESCQPYIQQLRADLDESRLTQDALESELKWAIEDKLKAERALAEHVTSTSELDLNHQPTLQRDFCGGASQLHHAPHGSEADAIFHRQPQPVSSREVIKEHNKLAELEGCIQHMVVCSQRLSSQFQSLANKYKKRNPHQKFSQPKQNDVLSCAPISTKRGPDNGISQSARPVKVVKRENAQSANTPLAEIRKAMIAKGLCFECGEKGHIHMMCPRKAKVPSPSKDEAPVELKELFR